MLKSVIGMRDKISGFTLIEILVVLLIISIVMTFAMTSFGDFGAKRAMIAEGQYLIHYIGLVRQESILDGETLGIRIDSTGYEVLRFQEPNHWQPMKSALFRHHSFRKGLNIHLNTAHKQSLLIVYPSGQITPFEAKLGTADEPNMVIISAQEDGFLSVKTP